MILCDERSRLGEKVFASFAVASAATVGACMANAFAARIADHLFVVVVVLENSSNSRSNSFAQHSLRFTIVDH